jgi:hypothetical protein
VPDRETFEIIVTDPAADPIFLVPEGGGEIAIHACRPEPICTLRHVDGQWTADYQPEHLDKAARAFVEAVQFVLGEHIDDQQEAERKAGNVTVRCHECGVIETGVHNDDLSEIEEEHVLTAHHPGLSFTRPNEGAERCA